ncbi:MAG: DUF2935 domain-containing protein [Bacilli bacterium]
MLPDSNFVQESISINLYYLRTIREFCLNIQTSLISFEQIYIQEAENIAIGCEELGNKIIKFANGKVPQKALDYQIYVTPYTLECEKLTEKLFNVKMATNITEAEMKLESGKIDSVTAELVDATEQINEQALILAQRLIDLCNELQNKMATNELFSYSYLTMIQFIIFETELYKSGLTRITQKIILDPSSVSNYEFYFNNSMQSIATFINKLVDPQDKEIVDNSNTFINAFANSAEIYMITPLNPENQYALTNREVALVKDFSEFIKFCIKELLNKRAYFIIEPIFLDNMYTQVNFFLYVLNYNQVSQ